MMIIPGDPDPDHAALCELRADFPELDISIGYLAQYQVWSARGRNGRNPWLVLSTDLRRFRHCLDGAGWEP